jgi:small ligand-binding sensory domain FIST
MALCCSSFVLITLQLGMISASTPFFSGRPFSLIYNGEWHSTGAVGVRIYTKAIDMKYTIPSGFKPMGQPMMVTECVLFSPSGEHGLDF